MARQPKALRIVLTGGGSGGHITPLLAVAHQLKQLEPGCQTIYIGQKGDSLGDIPAHDPAIDQVCMVRAGKLRRYHGEGLKQLLDLPTTGKNLRDAGYVAAGLTQSYRLLRRLRPDVVFVKGGFVGVPVGLASAMLGIPYITHDSDALPGLANRIIARWAELHAVALPKEVYAYPLAKTVTVGVPISHEFKLRTDKELAGIKEKLGLAADQRVVFVTGGGLGAQRLNKAVQSVAADLLQDYPDVVLVHLTGRKHEAEIAKYYDQLLSDTARPRVIVIGYTTTLFEYSAVADVVITRAGGTAMAEFAAQAKACIVVPNPLLTGGHQSKNAQALVDRQAIRVVDEAELAKDPQALRQPLWALMDDPAAVRTQGKRLHALAKPDAAKELAMVLLEQARKHKHSKVDNHKHEAPPSS